MKRAYVIGPILLILVVGILTFRNGLFYQFGSIRVTDALASGAACDAEKITLLIENFVDEYNQGYITDSSEYINRDFQWFSDTEVVDGQPVDHFVSHASHEKLLAYFQTQFELGETIEITKLHIRGDGWHGGADILYEGRSNTSNGSGRLSGKGMVDCQTNKIAVWSMATHYPNL